MHPASIASLRVASSSFAVMKMTGHFDHDAASRRCSILVDFGLEGWVGRFSLYAHNTFVSYLYELGLFGVAAFLWILISNFLGALHASSADTPILISCHIGFFVLNLATMPFWTLEGAILYALLLSQTWHLESTKVSEGELLRPEIGLRASGSVQSH